MTIERRIQMTAGGLILLVLVTAAILFWSSRQVERGLQRIEISAQALRSAFMLHVLMQDFMADGNRRHLTRWENHNELLGQIFGHETIFESIDQALLDDLRNSYQAVNLLFPRVVEMVAPAESRNQSQDLHAKEMVTGLMSLQSEQLVTAVNDLSEATQALTLKRRHFGQQLIVGLAITTVFLILINIYLISKSVINPLKVLSKEAERIGTGNFNYVAEIESDDEVGSLTRAFNLMVDGLERQTAALKKAQDELEQKVMDRTAELRLTNEKLLQEIEERERVQDLLRRQAEELARSNADLGQFAYVASHDLQEPLRNVASCLQLLEKKHSDKLGPEADQLMHYAVDSATQMKNLIQDL